MSANGHGYDDYARNEYHAHPSMCDVTAWLIIAIVAGLGWGFTAATTYLVMTIVRSNDKTYHHVGCGVCLGDNCDGAVAIAFGVPFPQSNPPRSCPATEPNESK